MTQHLTPNTDHPSPSILDRLIRFCLTNKLIVWLLVLFFIVWGIIVAPFDWNVPLLHRDPVPVDAIPDIGENQQIVFAEWMGRSPRDVEDQVTYPLTVSLLGVPGVKTIRSQSAFGFSMVFVIFNEKVDFYWSRSRVLEKLSSLPAGALPEGVQPVLGPDATPLGQVYWYTVEGRDQEGRATGGWDLDELRSAQDWQVRYALQSVEGVSEVASIGGFVREYQVDVDPDAMRAYRVTLEDVFAAVRKSNLDVGASVMEINRVEYTLRSVGFIKSARDLEDAVVKVVDNVPVYVRNVAHVSLGPELRRGALDKEGAEVVGGVVVVRHGENPLAVIKGVKHKIAEIAAGLPRKTLPDGTVSQLAITPFYDRTELIHETLGTLNTAIYLQVLITTLVVLIMVRHLASSMLIAAVMPLAVLGSFIAMRTFGIDANIVSLSGIAIAIGTVVDMGIIMCENILRRLNEEGDRCLVSGDGTTGGEAPTPTTQHPAPLETVYRASSEVGAAVLTAIATTVVSFLPVFTMEAAEGKLFKPLAFTKTFALIASVIIALTIIPAAAHVLFTRARKRSGAQARPRGRLVFATVLLVILFLTHEWFPLGPDRGLLRNLVLVAGMVGVMLLGFGAFQRHYARILAWCLANKRAFLSIPASLIVAGAFVWLGFERMFGWLPASIKTLAPVSAFAHAFPGLGKEFMPSLDEGSFLYMPSAMPHASLSETLDIMQKQDMAFHAIPEVGTVVGKLGRVESALDPAPVPMIETIILYNAKFMTDAAGRRLTFKYNARTNDFFRDADGAPLPAPDGEPYLVRGVFERDGQGRLIPDRNGKPFRLWRPALDPALNDGRPAWAGIERPDDIWDEIVAAGDVPGATSAPRLQPIETRIVMLQTGMRAAMGLKVRGPDLKTIEHVGLEMERVLKDVPMIEPATVIADRIIGRPYLEIVPDRQALARYGVKMEEFQDVVEVAIGGKRVTTTVEGRERYPVRVRYLRELRDSIEALERVLVPAMDGVQVPLIQVAEIRYARGPEMIKSEDTFLVGYVLFDKKPGYAEVDVIQQARNIIEQHIRDGSLQIPAGVSYTFAGSYENQVRAQKKLAVILPLSLFIIFLILYLHFKDYAVSFIVFSGILVAWAGGFLLIWCYNQPWFLNLSVFGMNLRELFQVHPINLSVAIWVGFLALFGVASDDGVVMCTYIQQRFREGRFATAEDIRQAVIEAGLRRVRPCMMTTATTVLALLPVLTSTGRGSDIMVPMAIPSFGGMLIAVITTLVAPVLYCALQESRLRRRALRAYPHA